MHHHFNRPILLRQLAQELISTNSNCIKWKRRVRSEAEPNIPVISSISEPIYDSRTRSILQISTTPGSLLARIEAPRPRPGMPPVRGRRGGRRGGRGGRPSKSRPSDAESPSLLIEEPPQPPFFNTTFSVHRVSPLHLGEQSDHGAMLRTLSERLRDTLIGDVVRGVYIGLDPTHTGELGQAGSLESVNLRWVRVSDVISKIDLDRRPPSRDLSSDAPLESGDGLGVLGMRRGIWIDIQYENAACTGMLLPDLSSREDERDGLQEQEQMWASEGRKTRSKRKNGVDPSHFLHLPLLLLRMPTPLKNIVVEWLSGVFDCRVGPLSLGTRCLVQVWETWLRTALVPDRAALAKEVVITLGFSLPHLEEEVTVGENGEEDEDGDQPKGKSVQQGLRTLEISIEPGDIENFVRAGEKIAEDKIKPQPRPWTGDARTRKILAGGHDEDGWSWKTGDEADQQQQPFIDALAYYLDHHLALNLFHPSVRITKIASPGFVLTDSRIKVFDTTDAESVCHLLADITKRSLGPELPRVF